MKKKITFLGIIAIVIVLLVLQLPAHLIKFDEVSFKKDDLTEETTYCDVDQDDVSDIKKALSLNTIWFDKFNIYKCLPENGYYIQVNDDTSINIGYMGTDNGLIQICRSGIIEYNAKISYEKTEQILEDLKEIFNKY